MVLEYFLHAIEGGRLPDELNHEAKRLVQGAALVTAQFDRNLLVDVDLVDVPRAHPRLVGTVCRVSAFVVRRDRD